VVAREEGILGKVTVRHAEVGDAEALHRIMTAQRVVAGTLQLPLQTVERTRKFLAEPPEGSYELVAVAKGEVIGELGLRTHPDSPRRHHVGEIGMAVRDDWQGKGIGTSLMKAALDLADNWLNLERIELNVYTDNAAGRALYEKFGFEIEGTHRRYAFREGQYVDAYSMARIKR
jgi:L-phenylalanine/L-methionine N-acetyltransferase